MEAEIRRHMDDEQIESYSMGHMTEEESARFEEHLLVCGSCQKRVSEADAFVAAMSAAALALQREPRAQNWYNMFFPRLTPLLAAAALAITLAVLGARMASRSAPPVAVALQAMRGATVQAPSARRLTLNLDMTGLPDRSVYRVSVVDASGRELWSGVARSVEGSGQAEIPGMNAGTYFVRLYAGSGELVREYGVEVAAKRR